MNDKLKPSKRVIVYEEFFDDCIDVSENDIKEYSQRLGIDLSVNPTLASSVRDWILQPLPRYWFPCLDTQTGHWFYSNTLNGQSTWHHPLEEIHRNLAKEYFSYPTILGAERENPEGESAEQSMESGFSTKGFGSLSSSISGGISPVRNPLPRALAPLKRIPPTANPLGTLSNPLPTFRSSNLHNEHVREVSFSTFKSGDPVSSLLPGDILFENRDRPTTIVAPFNHSIIPLSNSVIDSKEDDSHRLSTSQVKQPPRYSSAGKRAISPLTIDQSTGKELTASSISKSEQEPLVQQSKPRVSFTERLAAKKASQRLKSNESSESCLSNPIESDQTSAINSEKKHVHFDLEPNQFRQYTPECSEETKGVDKSESSSSEDILDLVGDPEFLKPLTDVNCYPTTYEEKRWEVSFTSFGLNSASGSPVKVSAGFVDNEDTNEMVTCFNSEYCPSPLPVFEKREDVGIEANETAIPINHFQDQTENETKMNSPVSESIVESNAVPEALPVIEMDVPTFCENTAQAFILSLQDEPMEKDVTSVNPSELDLPEVQKSVPSTEDNAKAVQEISVQSQIISKLTVEPQAVEDAQFTNLATKSRHPKLTRSSTRSESLETFILPEEFNPKTVPKVPACLDPFEFVTPELKSVEPQNHLVQSDGELNLNTTQEPSQFHLLLPPAPFSQLSPQTAMCTEETVTNSIHKKDDVILDAPKASEKKNPPLEDWLTMKRDMESALENEKKKLENWFSTEIAQIKKQFENELASERQRTENLSRLVENAKSEKEELAKREIVRLEETLSHLVEEKTRQVQTRLNSEILQSNSSFLQRLVDRQDANVQTEEPPIPVNSLPTEPMAPLLKCGEIGTSESNPSKNETYSRWESRDSPPPRRDSRIQCQCDSLQKQVARVEREMQLLKQKNLSFQKNPPTRKKSTPVKAQREPWWLDTDESATSTTSSVSDWRHSRGRSRSMTNLHATGDVSSGRKSAPFQRARDLLSRSQTPRRAWMEDVSTDHSMGDIPTSGISSAISTGEWDTVLSSIQKISGDLQEVWSHIGPRPRPLSYLSYQSPLWMPSQSSSQSFITNDRVPLHWSFSGSTAERTQALKLWLQQNKTQHSKPLL